MTFEAVQKHMQFRKRIISAHVVKISTLPENYFVADAAVRWSEYPVPQSKAYCTTIMPAPLI